MKKYLIALPIIVALTACEDWQIGGEYADPPAAHSFVEADWDNQPAGDEWTEFTSAALSRFGGNLQNSSIKDAAAYCPNFAALDDQGRNDFFVGLLSAMARFESSFDPKRKFTETFNDRNGNPVISRGLLQLSIESGNGGYQCGFADENALHDPQQNLECGVRIMNKLVGQNDYIGASVGGKWKGGARYWSVLRPTHSKNPKIRAFTQQMTICQL